MPVLARSTPAHEAIDKFTGHLAEHGFAVSTRRLRRHFLGEYLRHATQAADTTDLTAGELMDPARAAAWLSDAAAGKTRTRIPLRGRDAAAYPNSMRARIHSYNAFAEFLGLPDRLDTRPPAVGYRLTPSNTKRLLRELAASRPFYGEQAAVLRTAAVAALVADTDRNVPELARLKIRALHLDGDGDARVELSGGSCPLSEVTVAILGRWLAARAAIIAELQGSDPGHLWIPVQPGRPRGNRAPLKPGITPAAVRTLHAAHRNLVRQVLGTPLRPGAFREAGK